MEARTYHFCHDAMTRGRCWRVAYKMSGSASYWELSEPFSTLEDAKRWANDYDLALQRLASTAIEAMRRRAREIAQARNSARKATLRKQAQAKPRKPLKRARKSANANKTPRKRAP